MKRKEPNFHFSIRTATLFFSAFAMHGLIEDFIPNRAFIAIALTTAAIVTLTLFAADSVTTSPRSHANRGEHFNISTLVLFITRPAALFACVFLSVGYSFPAIYTRATGLSIKEVHSVSAISSSAPKTFQCSYRLVGDVFSRALPSYFCISKKMYDAESSEPTFVFSELRSNAGKLILAVEPN